MADQALPNDILREIGAHWDGHRMLYTCRSLYTSWNPDAHLITETTIIGWRAVITKYMPNGAYHGNSCVSRHQHSETVTYHRGQIVKSIYANMWGCSVKTLINGWTCMWVLIDGRGIDMTYPSDTDIGGVQLSPGRLDLIGSNYHMVSNVALQDFISVAQKHIANSGIRGECTTLMITDMWGKILPHTHTSVNS